MHGLAQVSGTTIELSALHELPQMSQRTASLSRVCASCKVGTVGQQTRQSHMTDAQQNTMARAGTGPICGAWSEGVAFRATHYTHVHV